MGDGGVRRYNMDAGVPLPPPEEEEEDEFLYSPAPPPPIPWTEDPTLMSMPLGPAPQLQPPDASPPWSPPPPGPLPALPAAQPRRAPRPRRRARPEAVAPPPTPGEYASPQAVDARRYLESTQEQPAPRAPSTEATRQALANIEGLGEARQALTDVDLSEALPEYSPAGVAAAEESIGMPLSRPATAPTSDADAVPEPGRALGDPRAERPLGDPRLPRRDPPGPTSKAGEFGDQALMNAVAALAAGEEGKGDDDDGRSDRQVRGDKEYDHRANMLRNMLETQGTSFEGRQLDTIGRGNLIQGLMRIAGATAGMGSGTFADPSNLTIDSTAALQAISQEAARRQRDRETRFDAIQEAQELSERGRVADRSADLTARGQDVVAARNRDTASYQQFTAETQRLQARVLNATRLNDDQREADLRDPTSGISGEVRNNVRGYAEAIQNNPVHRANPSMQRLIERAQDPDMSALTGIELSNDLSRMLPNILSRGQMRQMRRRSGGGGRGRGGGDESLRQVYLAVSRQIADDERNGPTRRALIAAVQDPSNSVEQLRVHFPRLAGNLDEQERSRAQEHLHQLQSQRQGLTGELVVGWEQDPNVSQPGMSASHRSHIQDADAASMEMVATLGELNATMRNIGVADIAAFLPPARQQNADIAQAMSLATTLQSNIGSNLLEMGVLSRSDLERLDNMLPAVADYSMLWPGALDQARGSVSALTTLALDRRDRYLRNQGLRPVAERVAGEREAAAAAPPPAPAAAPEGAAPAQEPPAQPSRSGGSSYRQRYEAR